MMIHAINKQSGFHKAVAIVPAIVLICAAMLSVYIFMWRPSDSDYQRAADITKSLRDKTNTLYSYTSLAKYPGLVQQSTVTTLEKTLGEHEKLSKNLSVAKVIERDQSLRQSYTKMESALNSYRDDAAAIASLIKDYSSVIIECGTLSKATTDIKTTSDFDAASEICLDAVVNGESSANTEFNSQFFTNYLTNIKSLVSAHRGVIAGTTTQASLNQVKDRISNMGEIVIDYKQSEAPMNEIDKLISDINDRKKTLLR